MAKLFVGGIKFEATEPQLADFFSQFGEVKSCKLVHDRETGRPRGFGFVEFASKGEADLAIQGANGAYFMGRPLNVNEAREREQTPRTGGQNQSRGSGREQYSDRGSNNNRGGY